MSLKIATYNCCSLKKNIDIVRELLEGVDILFLQETFITSDSLSLLQYINEDYHSVGVGAVCSNQNAGRPQGGLACLVRKTLSCNFNVVTCDDDFMIIDVNFQSFKLTLVNAYIRSDLGDAVSHANYLDNLYKLETILDEHSYDNILVLGDFNADPFYGRAWHSLENFIARNHFRCYDKDLLPQDSSTYISCANSHYKWPDRIIGRFSDRVNFDYITVNSDSIGSDHFPSLIGSLNVDPGADLKAFIKSQFYVDRRNLRTRSLKDAYNQQ